MQVDTFKTMVGGFGLTVQIQPERTFDAAFAAVESGSCRAVSNNWYGQYNAGHFGLVETPVVSAIAPAYRRLRASTPVASAIDRHLRQWQGDNGSVYFEILREWRSKDRKRRLHAILRVGVTLGELAYWRLLALAVVLWPGAASCCSEPAPASGSTPHAGHPGCHAGSLLFELDLDGRHIDVHAPRSDLLARRRATLGRAWFPSAASRRRAGGAGCAASSARGRVAQRHDLC